jgi:predicted double-glycine peptidase
MQARRDRAVVKQALDYSCGAAALATLMRFGFGDAVDEREIVNDLLAPLDGDAEVLRRKEGFSLLDLKTVAEGRGYAAAGFRIAPDDLGDLGGPVIIYFAPHGYAHFAVLKAIRRDRVFLADPSRGNLRVALHSFLDSWQGEDGRGVIFVIEPRAARARLDPEHERLAFPSERWGRPELLSAEQMLAVGSPFLRVERAGNR